MDRARSQAARTAKAAHGPRAADVVGVRELRQNLSVYLDRVKRGAVFQVTEHGRIVATLQPPGAAMARLDRLEAQGLVRRARHQVRDLPAPRPVPAGAPGSATVLDDLGADRL